ncbi:very-long-chain aldehyde decarbonylase GL1-5-like [Macadamia integrifolia]|uniref:very-long-chain aldehyde decarbonylase GL1-5-like n=1 Tax=Macadamia integrifolia TaxID=60698 RepID=UPI001C4FB7FE|nr:very-long-chain aldehyde decarbonylase GL1-5-like [Macadamia integrifolia]
MASKPGLLTDWPWQKLGNLKYLVLAPWVVHSVYSFVTKDETERDITNLLIFPFLLWRLLHNQLWISLARYHTAKSKHRIVDKSIEFEQVDRERNWDDQIILNGLLYYIGFMYLPGTSRMPIWRWKGLVLTTLLHMGPVEFLYYWFHRALHHHFLYSRYHSHHHSSIVTEPITAVIHPFAEHIGYFLLFSIPVLSMLFTRTASVVVFVGYVTYIDFMNCMGHCNFELVPKWVFNIFPFLKYLMYTPSFHSLHHTQFRTNYSLFMPFYDYIYGTMDKSTDKLYEDSLKGRKETPDVVHLMHPTTLQSFYHLPPAIASLASEPYSSRWYLSMFWPIPYEFMLLTWIFGSTFTVERNVFDKLKMQTWAIPRFSFHYSSPSQKDAINSVIERAVLEAENEGVKVLSLGLLNQGEQFNGNGEIYVQKHPNLKIRIVDGSSLAVAVVLHSIPKGTKEVLLRGNISKVVCAIAKNLCQRGIQVVVVGKDNFDKLMLRIPTELWTNLLLSTSYTQKVWLVGDGELSEKEQAGAAEGTHFIPWSQFPPKKKVRKDCIYYSTPAMTIPKALQNVYSCENWLPRRVMSAWRVAGIVHALEGWDAHECGDTMFDMEKIWLASLRHGFLPVQGQGHPLI